MKNYSNLLMSYSMSKFAFANSLKSRRKQNGNYCSSPGS